MTLILHLGRPYVLRTLRRCGLRLGADVWWMSYLLMRDAVLLMTFGLSWIFFSPNLVANDALPITGPLAALCLLLALAVKLSRRVDDDVMAYRLATAFLVLGATLYYFPLVFAVEATSQVHLSWFITNLTSNTNRNAGALDLVDLAGWCRGRCRLAVLPIHGLGQQDGHGRDGAAGQVCAGCRLSACQADASLITDRRAANPVTSQAQRRA